MKDDTSTPTPNDSPNTFESDKAGTAARDDAQAAIEKLRQKGGIFVEAVRATRMPMALSDPNLPGNPIVFANEAFLKLSGYSMAEVLGQQPHFMNGAGTDPRDAAHFEEAIRADQDDLIETVQYRKNGSRFVATVLVSAFKDSEGKTLNHFMSWLDVTRRVEAEDEVSELRRTQEALRVGEAKYRGLLNSIDEGFCIIDVIFDEAGHPIDYLFLETNPAFVRQTGIDDAVGKRMREIAPDHEQHWFDIYGRIALTGTPERFEQPAEALGRYYDVYAFRVGPPEKNHVAILFNDVGDRKRAEKEARENEERQAFLLALGDAMRAESSADDKIAAAARLLGEKLGAPRVLYAEYDHEKGLAYIFNGWLADGAQPFPAVVKLDDFEGDVLNDLRQGRIVRVDDVGRLGAESGYAAIANVGVQALLSPPLLVEGKLKFNVSIHQHEPRHWTDDEVALVQEVSERLWAEIVRARAEEALRASEEKYRTLFETMGQGYCELELVRDEQGRAVDQLYLELNPAFERLFGVPVAQAKGRKASEVFPFVDPFWHESFDEVASTGTYKRLEHQHGPLQPWFEVFAYPAGGDRVIVLYDEITDRKRAEEALRQSERHANLLLAELQHRVRNTLAVIRSIARRTAENSSSAEDMLAHFQGRLDAFSRVQAALTRNAEGRVDLMSIVEDELIAHASHGGEQVQITGPEILLKPKMAERLSLAVHELTTNAVKYGALTNGDGSIRISWAKEQNGAGEQFVLHWTESGVDVDAEKASHEGFGMELLRRSLPYDLGAETKVDLTPQGLRFELRMPFPNGSDLTKVKTEA